MSVDLRSFLAEHADAVYRPPGSVSIDYEITALQHLLGVRRCYPVLFAERPRMNSGEVSSMPVVTNVMASRALVAHALGVEDHRRAAPAMATRVLSRVAPERIGRDAAPVHETVLSAREVDLGRLPVLRQHQGDGARALSAAHCVTSDPETGATSTSVHRCAVHDTRRLVLHPGERSHAQRDLHRWWARGKPCPVALWIGHHPAVETGARARHAGSAGDWDTVGSIAGHAVRLVPSLTHGDAVMVPADAEIVIEGWCPPGELVDAGPWADGAGYVDGGGPAPIVSVTCMTHRRGALYHDIGVGLEGHLVPGALAMEGALFARVKPVAPSLVNVHVPFAARTSHAVFQFLDPRPGEARDALATALAVRGLRAAIAVDEDVDPLDEGAIMWALATRIQWHRDVIRIGGLTRPDPDPSAPAGARTVAKLGIDATLPPATRPGAPKPFTPAIGVPDAAAGRAEQVLAGIDLEGFPSR